MTYAITRPYLSYTGTSEDWDFFEVHIPGEHLCKVGLKPLTYEQLKEFFEAVADTGFSFDVIRSATDAEDKKPENQAERVAAVLKAARLWNEPHVIWGRKYQYTYGAYSSEEEAHEVIRLYKMKDASVVRTAIERSDTVFATVRWNLRHEYKVMSFEELRDSLLTIVDDKIEKCVRDRNYALYDLCSLGEKVSGACPGKAGKRILRDACLELGISIACYDSGELAYAALRDDSAVFPMKLYQLLLQKNTERP